MLGQDRLVIQANLTQKFGQIMFEPMSNVIMTLKPMTLVQMAFKLITVEVMIF